MNTIPFALTRVCWRRDASLLLSLSLGLLFTPLLYGVLAVAGVRDFSGNRASTHLHFAMLAALQIQTVACVVQLVGTPRSRYVLPVSVRRLVGWTLLNTMLAAGGAYLLEASLLNWLCRADWPLWGPAAFSMSVAATALAIAWGLANSRALQFIASLLATALLLSWLVMRYGMHLPPSDPRAISLWTTVTLSDAAFVASVVLVATVATLAGVSRDRRGDGWTLPLDLLTGWFPRTGGEEQRATRQFASGRSAQFWYEWRTRGLFMFSPAVLLSAFGIILAVLLNSHDAAVAVWIGPTYTVLCGPLIGVMLGHRAADLSYTTYDATRPLSDGDLGRAVLKNLAASVAWATGILLIGSLISASILAFRGYHEVLLEAVQRWTQSGMWPVALAVGGLTIWTGTGLGASCGLTRKWLAYATIFLGMFALIASVFIYNFVIPEELRPTVWRTTLQGCGLCSASGTILALRLARRHGHIRGRTIWQISAGWLLLLGLATYVWFRLDHPQPGIFALLAPGLAALPFLPLATVPLAIAWNRHR